MSIQQNGRNEKDKPIIGKDMEEVQLLHVVQSVYCHNYFENLLSIIDYKAAL